MKSNYNPLQTKKDSEAKKTLIIGIIILMLQIIFHLSVGAQSPLDVPIRVSDSIKNEMGRQLNDSSVLKRLNFPNSVKRFYRLDHSPIWLRPQDKIRPTVDAMLVLDCVRQYGLQRKDYHPEILTYERMYNALQLKAIPAAQKIEFELMLTDAIISMINHLHYGAYNPNLNAASIDNGLSTENFLINAIKGPNLMDSILSVQPKIDQYKKLQGYMKLIAGQYTCNSYETPEEEIRTIALNMERLRWREIKTDTYLHVNIPSFTSTFFSQNGSHQFKIVVGKPSTPTPTLASEITHLESSPDWAVPQKIFMNELLPKALKDHSFFRNNHMAVYDKKENMVLITTKSLAEISKFPWKYHLRQSKGCDNALGKVIFRFDNKFAIFIHDTPEKQYFVRSKRAFSHGCIRVDQAEKLASLILTSDHQVAQITKLKNAMRNNHQEKFVLKTPVSLLISYLTVTVQDGLLVRHDDVYKLDKILMTRMYGMKDQATIKTHVQ